MAEDVHDSLIRDRQAKLEKHLAQVELLKAEIKALQEAQAMFKNGRPVKTRGKRNRPLDEKWATILKFIGKKGSASLDEIMNTYDFIYDLNKDTLRGQMANYHKNGWVERVSDGIFQLTDSGAQKCGYAQKESPPAGGDMVEGSDPPF